MRHHEKQCIHPWFCWCDWLTFHAPLLNTMQNFLLCFAASPVFAFASASALSLSSDNSTMSMMQHGRMEHFLKADKFYASV